MIPEGRTRILRRQKKKKLSFRLVVIVAHRPVPRWYVEKMNERNHPFRRSREGGCQEELQPQPLPPRPPTSSPFPSLLAPCAPTLWVSFSRSGARLPTWWRGSLAAPLGLDPPPPASLCIRPQDFLLAGSCSRVWVRSIHGLGTLARTGLLGGSSTQPHHFPDRND